MCSSSSTSALFVSYKSGISYIGKDPPQLLWYPVFFIAIGIMCELYGPSVCIMTSGIARIRKLRGYSMSAYVTHTCQESGGILMP